MEHSLTTEELSHLVDLTGAYSSSDLTRVCRQAAMAPVRELLLDSTGGCCGGPAGVALAVGPGGAPSTQLPPVLRRLQLKDFVLAVMLVRPAAEDQQRAHEVEE